ncbi:MAG: hypothetical protein HYZ57_03535 [Acidobacteria bacterium]|nr:hypothetical protein [Acidobacteriota bacterium]MBI3278897.1 hypothetical protein [Acidobacteriota bacterium]
MCLVNCLTIRLLTMCALGVVFTLGAQNYAFTVNTSVPTDTTVGNACVAEGVNLSGKIRQTVHVNGDSSGGYHMTVLSEHNGMTGTGDTTGAKYQGFGSTRESLQSSGVLPIRVTTQRQFRLIGQGTAQNTVVHYQSHMTVNANGSVTASVDDLNIVCN